MTLYEANQEMYKGVPSITDMHGVWKQIRDYIKAHPSKYYLMLSNEKRYYTLYTFKGEYKFGDMASEILDISKDLGEFKDVMVNDNGALEFWIVYDGEPTMFVLFDYARGVVEV